MADYQETIGIRSDLVGQEATTEMRSNSVQALANRGNALREQARRGSLERSNDPSAHRAFRVLAVLDGRAGTFQLDIDAHYDVKYVLDVSGRLGAEARRTRRLAW